MALRNLKLIIEISSTPLQCFFLEQAILKFISHDPVDRLLAAPQAGDFNITASLFYIMSPPCSASKRNIFIPAGFSREAWKNPFSNNLK